MNETRRIWGVLAEATGEKRLCPNCKSEQPVWKTIVKVDTMQMAGLWCGTCEKYLDGYKIERPAAPAASEDAPAAPSQPAELTDQSPMPIGKKYGPHSPDPRKLGDVPANYLLFIADQEWIGKFPALKAYIEKNRSILEKDRP